MHSAKLFAITLVAGSLALTMAAVAANLIIRAPVAGGGVAGGARAELTPEQQAQLDDIVAALAALNGRLDTTDGELAAIRATLGTPSGADLAADIAAIPVPTGGTPTNSGVVRYSSVNKDGFDETVASAVYTALRAGNEVRLFCAEGSDEIFTGIAYWTDYDPGAAGTIQFTYAGDVQSYGVLRCRWNNNNGNQTCGRNGDPFAFDAFNGLCSVGWVLVW